MKKKYFVAVRFIALVSAILFVNSLSYATQSRLAGMGLQNWMIDDDANIWMSPAYINDYPNRIWGDLGLGGQGGGGSELVSGQWGGGSLRLLWGLLGHGGVFFSRPYTGLTGMTGVSPATGDCDVLGPGNIGAAQVAYAGLFPGGGVNMGTLSPANKIDIFYGLGLGQFLKLGVVGNIASNYYKYESTMLTSPTKATNDGSLKGERSTAEVNVGAGITIGQLGPIPQLDVFGNVGIPLIKNVYEERAWVAASSKDKTADYSLTNPGSFILNAGTRLKLTLWNLKFLVFGSWRMDNLPSLYTKKVDSDTDAQLEADYKAERTYTSNFIDVGIGFNHQIGDKTLLVIAVGANVWLQTNNARETDPIALAQKDEYNWSELFVGIPINIAVEHQLPWWGLIGRAGIRLTYRFETDNTNDVDYDTAGNKILERNSAIPRDVTIPIVVSLGLGKQITDTLSADLVVRQAAAWMEGLLGDLTTQMSLVYRFK